MPMGPPLTLWCPQGESDPRFHLERVASWATRRWGHPSQYRGSLSRPATGVRGGGGRKGELPAVDDPGDIDGQFSGKLPDDVLYSVHGIIEAADVCAVVHLGAIHRVGC